MTLSESPTVSVSRRGFPRGDADSTVVWVRGEHDIATRASLAGTLARAAQLEDAPLLVDLSSVTFMDASTIGALVAFRNGLRSRGHALHLRAPSPRALLLLELCGLTHLIERQPALPAGVPALASWVNIRAIAPRAEVETRSGRVAAHPAGGARARLRVTGDATVGVPRAAVDVDGRGL